MKAYKCERKTSEKPLRVISVESAGIIPPPWGLTEEIAVAAFIEEQQYGLERCRWTMANLTKDIQDASELLKQYTEEAQ